ncbi:MAG: hypothetical protein AAFR97_15775 [Bacteroidota bacterium]
MKSKDIGYILLGAAAVYFLTQSNRPRYAPPFYQAPPPPPRNRAAEYQAWINLILQTYGNVAALWQPGGPFYNQGIPQNPGSNFTGDLPDYSNVAGTRLGGRSCRYLPSRRLVV